MRGILPQEKVHLLEENMDLGKSTKEEPPIATKIVTSEESDEFTMQLQEDGQVFKIRRGLTQEEEARLMQMILDCGGILKTIVSTHDINLKDNVFLRDFFTLATEYKKECHDISNALVSLSSKIKSIHQ